VVDHDDRGSRVNKPVEHAHQHRDAQRVQALVGSSKTCSAPRWLLRGLRVFNARGPGYARGPDAPGEDFRARRAVWAGSTRGRGTSETS